MFMIQMGNYYIFCRTSIVFISQWVNYYTDLLGIRCFDSARKDIAAPCEYMRTVSVGCSYYLIVDISGQRHI